MLLQVEGLTKRFGATLAVDSLSFELRGGEVVGLLGPNGAGKSTTFLCTAGFLRPDRGSFRLDGKDLGAERTQSVALIPETPDVYAMLTVWEHLIFVAKSCRLRPGWEQRARALIERLGIAEQHDTLGAALSKGMRQKLLVSATVLAQTPAILFDEPMVGLDPLGQRELRGIIGDLKGEGVAVMISTHILEQAESICDRAVILKNGRNIAQGSFDELRARTGNFSVEDAFIELTR